MLGKLFQFISCQLLLNNINLIINTFYFKFCKIMNNYSFLNY